MTVVPIVVDERASIATERPDHPTVTLHMDVETYAAVAFGRWPAEGPTLDDR